jgi:hypothetical protein
MVNDLRQDERELAGAILEGSKRRTDQAFGDYYRGRNSSCALGAAYEGIGSIACSNASKAWSARVPKAARRSCRSARSSST